MKTITFACLRKGYAVKVISIVLTIGIILSISVCAFANTYHYGVFKLSKLEGYNGNNNSWGTSSASMAIGSLTGTYKWGMDYYKPSGAGRYQMAQIKNTYYAYGYTGSDADFVSDVNTVAPSIALRPGLVAPDAINGTNKFIGRILLLSDDTAKVQVSLTSNIPINQIILSPFDSTTNTNRGSYALRSGIDYVKNGELYLINYVFPVSQYGNMTQFELIFEAEPSSNAATGKVYWNEDYWTIKLNRSLIPIWSKSNLSGNSTVNNNPTSNITNITYNYSANLDGIYNLLSIICDWENLQFETEIGMLEELTEATQLLDQLWSMLMILDSDLGIISGDVTDILSAMYYSPGVTWSEHLYLRVSEVTQYVYDARNWLSTISSQLSTINTNMHNDITSFHADNTAENEAILDKLTDLENQLKAIGAKLDDIYDWLEDLDLENGSQTKTFMQSVFAWIKQLLVVIVGVFASVITVPTLSVITDYNSDNSAELFPEVE